jgi:C-terminal processing protease CtpA/Prc
VQRGNKQLTVVAQNRGGWQTFTNEIKEGYKILNGNIGYLNLSNLKDKDLDIAMLALKNTKSIIIDDRGYPSFGAMTKLLAYFVDKKNIKFLSFKSNSSYYLGVFETAQDEFHLPKSDYNYTGQIVFLTSPVTQSYAETISMLFKTYTNAQFVGERTSSSNGNVLYCPLPLGLKFRMTGLWTGNIDGSQYQRKGTIPDEYIEYDPYSFRNGMDNQIQGALNWIKSIYP